MLVLVMSFTATAAELTRIEQAREQLKANKPEETIELLSSFNPDTQDFALYHALYAQALVQAKQYYESIEHFRLASLYAHTPAEKERTLIDRAETYRTMSYYAEAAVCYRSFLQQFPQSTFSARAQLGLAESLYHLDRFADSIEAYDKAGDTPQTLAGKANALHNLGKYREANDLYLALLARDKKYVDASQETLYSMGENFRRLGKSLDAKIYFNSIRNPDLQLRAAVGLGIIAMSENKFLSATKLFTEALNSPDRKMHQQALLSLAEAQLKLGNQDEAMARLLELRTRYPYGQIYDSAILLLARLYRGQGKAGDALPLLSELVCRKSPNAEALDELESLVLGLKDKDRNELARIWAVAGHWLLDPNRIPSVVKIARGLRHTGKPYLDICRWLIKNGKEDVKAQGRLLLADFYADMGEAATASQYEKRARKIVREDETLRTQARVLFVNGSYPEAADSLMRIQEVSERDLLLLLDTAVSLKEPQKALAFLETQFAKKEWSATAAVRFADFLYDKGKTQEALKHYASVAAKKIDAKQVPPDVEWACYRVSLLADTKEAAEALTKITRSKNAVGRFAGADLKAMKISERVP